MPPIEKDLSERFGSASRALAIGVILLATLVLLGRLTDRPIPPLREPILFSTGSAWLLVLAGLSLWLRGALVNRWWRRCSVICALAVSTVALAACVGHLVADPLQTAAGGQFWSGIRLVAPQSAVAFLLGGLSLLLLDWEPKRGIRPAQLLSLVVVAIALVPLLGYVYDVPLLYSAAASPPIPMHEAVSLLLLGLALLFARPDRGLMQLVTSRTAGGFLVRRVPAGVIAVSIVFGWLTLKGQRSAGWDPPTGIAMFVLANIGFWSLFFFRLSRGLDRTGQAHMLSEEAFTEVFRASPDAMIVSRLADGRIVEANDEFLTLTGFPQQEVIGRTADDLVVRVEPPVPATTSTDARTAIRNADVRLRTKAGEEWTGLYSTEAVNFRGEPCLLTVTHDVSDRQQAQAAAQSTNEQLSLWVAELETRSREISLLNEMSGVLQSCVTPAEACSIAIRFGQQLLPASSGAICLFADEGGVLEATAVWGDLSTGMMFTPQECWALRRGRPYAVLDPGAGILCAHVQPALGSASVCVPMMAQGETLGILHVRDDEGPTSGAAPATRPPDSTQRLAEALAAHVSLALANLRLRDTLRQQSTRDELTGLYNRRFMVEALERELLRARRARRTITLILLDLDQFKAINDTRGHEAGDEILKAVGQLFHTFLRAGDIVCRYGGDEFLFVMPELALPTALARASQICEAVKHIAVWHQGRTLGPIAASAGVSVFPNHGDTTAQLLGAADVALYRVKARGGDSADAGKGAIEMNDLGGAAS